MLTINNPDDAEKRQNVKPPCDDEIKLMLTILQHYSITTLFLRDASGNELNKQLNTIIEPTLQRLLWSYENYRHFFEVVGGWDGLSKLQERQISTPFDGYSNPVAEMLQKGIETIKIKNNDTSK